MALIPMKTWRRERWQIKKSKLPKHEEARSMPTIPVLIPSEVQASCRELLKFNCFVYFSDHEFADEDLSQTLSRGIIYYLKAIRR